MRVCIGYGMLCPWHLFYHSSYCVCLTSSTNECVHFIVVVLTLSLISVYSTLVHLTHDVTVDNVTVVKCVVPVVYGVFEGSVYPACRHVSGGSYIEPYPAVSFLFCSICFGDIHLRFTPETCDDIDVRFSA